MSSIQKANSSSEAISNRHADMEQSTLSNATNNCGFEPHDYLEIKFALISVVGTLIGLFGLFGNASTALILTRPSMRNPNNLFLTALAVYDSCLLITAFFIYGMEYVIEFTRAFDLYVAWLTYLKFAFALSHISQTGSVYITVTVTIERYLAVCHPRKSKRLCSIGGAAWSILGVTTFAVIFNATKFFELEVTLNPDCPDGNDWQSYILLPSTMAASPIYQQIYSLWMTQTVMVFFPFITLLVFNSIIAYTIRKSLKKFDYQQEKISGRNELKERSREATVVLVTIVFIFLICNFWGFVITLLERIMDADTLMVKYHAFYTFSREAINFLAIINSSLNFFIQFVIAKDFRKEFIVVYGCGIRGVTVRLPVNDKFNIWRSWTRRTKDLRRSVSARGTRFVRRVSSIPSTSGGQLSTPQTPAPKLSASSICRNHEESPLKAIAEAQGRSSNGYGTSNAHTMLLMHDTTNGYYCALAEGTPC